MSDAVGDADAMAPMRGGGRLPALDLQAEIAYEAVADLINQVIAIYSAELWQQEHATIADPDKLAELRRLMAHYAEVRQSLRPDDSDEVARITEECGAFIRASRGMSL